LRCLPVNRSIANPAANCSPSRPEEVELFGLARL
jgi:hypothetical protein